MPLGLVIIKWDNKIGGMVEARYLRRGWIPPALPTTLLSMHFPTMKVDQNGVDFVKTKIGALRVLSYFTGVKTKRTIALILEESENPDLYKEKLIQLAEKVNSEIEDYTCKLPKYYSEIFEK
ncbi:MAG: hypothetical protein OdinLCB4_000390 [Candidatus Odinarchaeum yellowstonii]|jgi:hypothetical protein|uniref:Uncharacterized protein n=1 Tax=Odinarchaeota yellowstonii (strain LCB_4) TaxID=1841599 RepID=A0AAF0D2F8_ODILC|nr:MAG: hypothetical protein OdinLCB4_000390 [Candidatus Odinarchaeum yellowstonii]